jgi:hypothetical protein
LAVAKRRTFSQLSPLPQAVPPVPHIIEPHEVMPMARETIALRALLAKDMNRRGLFPERLLEQHPLRGAARRPIYHLVR